MADRKRRWGDRYDAERVRDVDSLHNIMPHLMRKRTDAEVYTCMQMDVTDMLTMLERVNRDAETKTAFFHCILTTVARVLRQRSDLNMYVSGRNYYRRHDISLAFIAKKNFSDGAKESVIIINAEDDWNVEGFRDKVLYEVDRSRNETSYGVDSTLDTMKKLPRCINMIVMAGLRFLDFYNLAPKSLSKGDSNYASVLVTNLGSIKGPAIYHHLNNYGTNSIIIAIGTLHKAEIISGDGTKAVRDVVDIGVTIDERIADGAYFIRSLNLFKYILEHPDVLYRPISEEIEYEQ